MNDQGDWLSAQQAVMPDGSEISGLRLVNKKLPPLVPSLVPPSELSQEHQTGSDKAPPSPEQTQT